MKKRIHLLVSEQVWTDFGTACETQPIGKTKIIEALMKAFIDGSIEVTVKASLSTDK